MSIFDKFKLGLSKSSKSLSSGLNDLIFKKKIDENMLDELEDFLIQCDVGVESAKELREKFASTKVNPKDSGKNEIFKIFSNYTSEILKPLEKNLEIKINGVDGKEITGGFALSVGNPHIVFFVEDFNRFNLKEIGPKIEYHNYFPEKCNVTLANIKNKNHIKVKVWERGAGLTKACGTAACATAVSGAVLKFNERFVDIEFSEGILNIDWKENNNIYMTGKVSEIKKIKVKI